MGFSSSFLPPILFGPIEKNVTFQQPQSEACVLCEYVIQTLDSMLQDKTDKDAVKQALVSP